MQHWPRVTMCFCICKWNLNRKIPKISKRSRVEDRFGSRVLMNREYLIHTGGCVVQIFSKKKKKKKKTKKKPYLTPSPPGTLSVTNRSGGCRYDFELIGFWCGKMMKHQADFSSRRLVFKRPQHTNSSKDTVKIRCIWRIPTLMPAHTFSAKLLTSLWVVLNVKLNFLKI